MSESDKPRPGSIVWQDLTVPDATAIRDFYAQVVGWESEEHDMGDYADYDISPAGSEDVVAGICHARGENAALPGQWLLYVAVEDVKASAERCKALGGKILDGPRKMGESLYCALQDPAGAVLALIEV